MDQTEEESFFTRNRSPIWILILLSALFAAWLLLGYWS